MRMRAVIFDLDGTLADTSGDLIASANACFEGLGMEVRLDPKADQLTAFGGGKAMLRLGFSRSDRPWTEEDIAAQYPVLLRAYAEAIDHHTTLYPGAVDAVEALRRAGFATAICTNKPEALAQTLCRNLGIRDLFGALIGADTLPQRKPDPAPYHACLAAIGGDLGRSMLIGDTVTDRDTARAVGVPIVLVGFGPEGQGVTRLEPDALLHHYEDLPEMALRMLGPA
jgi:phosphoglycolate phosphatase